MTCWASVVRTLQPRRSRLAALSSLVVSRLDRWQQGLFAGAPTANHFLAARLSTQAARDDPAEELSGLRPAAAAQVSYAELASTIYSVSQKLGPVTLGDLVFGIQALAKQHAAKRLTYHIQGPEVAGREDLLQLLEAADLAFGAYKRNPQSLCAVTSLPLHSIVRFCPEAVSLQPAYFIAVDHHRKAIVWGIRGTKHIHDVLTDLCSSSTPFAGGQVHWGMWQAAQMLLCNELPRLVRLSSSHPGYELLLVGHSLGGGVAAILSHLLNIRLALRRRLHHCPRVHAICMGPAVVMSREVAAACRPWVTSLVCGHDAVPRFSMVNIRRVKQELVEIDWYGELVRGVFEMEYVKSVSQALSSAGSTTAGAAAHLQRLGSELLASGQVQRVYDTLGLVLYGRKDKPQLQQALDTATSTPAATAVAADDDSSSEQVAGSKQRSQGNGAGQQEMEALVGKDDWQTHRRVWRSEQEMLADQEEAWRSAWLRLSQARQGVEQHRLRQFEIKQQQQGGQSCQGAAAGPQPASGAPSPTAGQQLPLGAGPDGWQWEVMHTWVTDTATRYLPQLSLPAVQEADVRRMADAAVQTLTHQLQQMTQLLKPSTETLTSTKQVADMAVSSWTDGVEQVRRMLPSFSANLPSERALAQALEAPVTPATHSPSEGGQTQQQLQPQKQMVQRSRQDAAAVSQQLGPAGDSRGDSEVSDSSLAALTELVQLYPPGRLLYLQQVPTRPAVPDDGLHSPTAAAAAQPSDAGTDPLPVEGSQATSATSSTGTIGGASSAGPDQGTSGTAAIPAAAGQDWTRTDAASRLHQQHRPMHRLVEVPEGDYSSFERLVLHPSMLADHRMRSYRTGLLDLLRAAVAQRA